MAHSSGVSQSSPSRKCTVYDQARLAMSPSNSTNASPAYKLGSYEPKPEYTAPMAKSQATPEVQSSESESTRRFILTPLEGTICPEANILDHDIHLLHKANHTDPFSVLGPHVFSTPTHRRGLVVRAWVKDAGSVRVRFLPNSSCTLSIASNNDDGWVSMDERCDWLFQKSFTWEPATDAESIEAETNLLKMVTPKYELEVVYRGDATVTKYVLRDTYNFGCSLPQKDLELFQSGSCWHVDNLMGSHLVTVDKTPGVRFSVWAPNAVFVRVVGDFNQWDGRAHPMRRRHEFGVWELFIPNIAKAGDRYGYLIHSQAGTDFVKIDPYAQEFENPPAHASIISSDDDAYKQEDDRYKWEDAEWMQTRLDNAENVSRLPMSIYEVHLPSWMRGDGNAYLSYRELAHRLVDHCKKMNFTHVEFLPLAHHPFEGSWGYQVSGLYAPYSRLGKPDDLKYLIDQLHQAGLGVFVDFVPGHFVKDAWGLVHYDGQPCFEYADPREGEHRTWGTMVFNFRRNEVRSFLLGAAYHWLRRYHVDGLRIDAVSPMLYKNYCRDEGDWLPNEFGGDANLEAINMLQELNWVVHREFPGVFTMAEEATSWKGVTDKKDGLGFDAKWDLGWMNDSLSYLCTPPPLRPSKHSRLTFRGLYMAHEKWVLPLSHDEVVSGKGSLLDKCGFSGAPFEERLSTLKALFVYQIGICGRPLIFMGAEFGQGREWKESRSIDWHEAEEPARKQCMTCLSDLLALYKNKPALHSGDDEPWNFKWTDCDDASSCTIAFLRNYMEWHNDLLIVCNFSGVKQYRYGVGVPHGGRWKVLLNTDDWKYGGGMSGPGMGNEIQTTQGGRLGWPYCLWFDLPPFGALILQCPQPESEDKENRTVDNKSETATVKTTAPETALQTETTEIKAEAAVIETETAVKETETAVKETETAVKEADTETCTATKNTDTE